MKIKRVLELFESLNSREMLDRLCSFGGGYEYAANKLEDFLDNDGYVERQDFIELYNIIWPAINRQVKEDQQSGVSGYGRRFTFAQQVIDTLADRSSL
jgi:hypothetical protein